MFLKLLFSLIYWRPKANYRCLVPTKVPIKPCSPKKLNLNFVNQSQVNMSCETKYEKVIWEKKIKKKFYELRSLVKCVLTFLWIFLVHLNITFGKLFFLVVKEAGGKQRRQNELSWTWNKRMMKFLTQQPPGLTRITKAQNKCVWEQHQQLSLLPQADGHCQF